MNNTSLVEKLSSQFYVIIIIIVISKYQFRTLAYHEGIVGTHSPRENSFNVSKSNRV